METTSGAEDVKPPVLCLQNLVEDVDLDDLDKYLPFLELSPETFSTPDVIRPTNPVSETASRKNSEIIKIN